MTAAPSANVISQALARATAALDATRTGGAFRGRLSTSALSTATASIAFETAHRARPDPTRARLAARARAWLAAHQNADGGFGDTVESPTNISTTTLAWCALGLAAADDDREVKAAGARAEAWLREECGGSLEPDVIASTIRGRYGADQTFSVPILLTCAISGRLGDAGWRLVPNLPFELAACPHAWFKLLNLRTVSYALPALIAVGQARHHHRPTKNPITRAARVLTRKRTLRLLRDIQPSGGGYLEAAPLTSFVSMSLISMGLVDQDVVRDGLGFLADTVRPDGSWPIDTNLDTWTTTLAVNALRRPDDDALAWLRAQHYVEEHPYTRAAPGGFAWTDLPGGVPDADDTSGALIALHHLTRGDDARRAHQGVRWLLDLQNRDGGIPTFCRGWGKLPFDQSCPDITAHALRAFSTWRDTLPDALRLRTDRATTAAVSYLTRVQRADGAWVPLWFGNQHQADQENPLYGTSRVLLAARLLPAESGERARRWMLDAQDRSGGFGGDRGLPPTIEETALALEALARLRPIDEELNGAVARAAAWLIEATDGGTRFPASPIGLYFAKLWYSEALYPVLFTVAGLRATLDRREESAC